MQPYMIPLFFFAICLAHGIYRAIQDVRQEAAQAYFDAAVQQMREAMQKMTGLSEAFIGLAKSTESASESRRRFPIIFDSPSGMIGDGRELLLKDWAQS